MKTLQGSGVGSLTANSSVTMSTKEVNEKITQYKQLLVDFVGRFEEVGTEPAL